MSKKSFSATDVITTEFMNQFVQEVQIKGDLSSNVEPVGYKEIPSVKAVNDKFATIKDVDNKFTTVCSLNDARLNDSRKCNNTFDNSAAAKTNLGLGSVNNTSDADKPISTATQNALNAKISKETVNVAIGNSATAYGTKGIAIGENAKATGERSVSIGDQTFCNYLAGTCVGSGAEARDGNDATAYGFHASAIGPGSTALGSDATVNGTDSLVIGRMSTAGTSSKKVNNAVLVGYNTKIEQEYSNHNLDGSILIGANANISHSGGYYGTSGRSIAIGEGARVSSFASAPHSFAGVSNSIALGHNSSVSSSNGSIANSVALGCDNTVASSNTIKLGNSYITQLLCARNITTTSDERDKADIAELSNCLSFIKEIKPIQYVKNDRDWYISESDKKNEEYAAFGMTKYDTAAHERGDKKRARKRVGMSAQQVQGALKKVYNSDNYADIVNDNFYEMTDKPQNVENQLTVSYSEFIPFLIGAIKEQQQQIDELKRQLNAQV